MAIDASRRADADRGGLTIKFESSALIDGDAEQNSESAESSVPPKKVAPAAAAKKVVGAQKEAELAKKEQERTEEDRQNRASLAMAANEVKFKVAAAAKAATAEKAPAAQSVQERMRARAANARRQAK